MTSIEQLRQFSIKQLIGVIGKSMVCNLIYKVCYKHKSTLSVNMTTFDKLPSFLVTIVFQKFDFEDFANAFKVWMLGKSFAERTDALSRMDLCRFFMNMHHSEQFPLFMNYAYHLGVYDAMYYRAIWHVVEKTPYYKNGLELLHALKDKGHGRSGFFFEFFTIIYSQGDYNSSIELLTAAANDAFYMRNIQQWVTELQIFKYNWFSKRHEFSTLPRICSFMNSGNSKHFSRGGWRLHARDVCCIRCCRCKIALLLYDFCENFYN